MHTGSQKATESSPPTRLGTFRHAVRNGMLSAPIMLTLGACSDDRAEQHANGRAEQARQTIVVQVPAATWPQPPTPQYITPPLQRQAPVSASGNPWAVQTQPREYGQYRSQQWGQPQPRQPRYVQPPAGPQYRPLEPEPTAGTPQAPVAPQPIQGYRTVAPYDRLSGSSFGTPSYPYGGAYPGYYGPGPYGAPGAVYVPRWPGYW